MVCNVNITCRRITRVFKVKGQQAVRYCVFAYLGDESVVPVWPLGSDDGHKEWCDGTQPRRDQHHPYDRQAIDEYAGREIEHNSHN